jgi:hypothetical protein
MYHWKMCSYCNADDKKQQMTALLPVSRYSLRLHKEIKAALDSGLTGHHELLTYAVAKRHGMKVRGYHAAKVLGRNFCGGGCIWSMERYEAELALPPLKTKGGGAVTGTGAYHPFANRLYHPVKV